MKTFRCDFGGEVSCEIQVTDEPPEKGMSHIQTCTWSGTPSKALFRPYIRWMNSVNRQLADEWGITIMYVFPFSETKSEVWVYVPGEQPRKTEVVGRAQ